MIREDAGAESDISAARRSQWILRMSRHGLEPRWNDLGLVVAEAIGEQVGSSGMVRGWARPLNAARFELVVANSGVKRHDPGDLGEHVGGANVIERAWLAELLSGALRQL